MEFDLPEKITDEFLSEQVWKPGPIHSYETCELGLVRRTKCTNIKGVFPGYLYGPKPAIKRGTHYRLNPPFEKTASYLLPKNIMKQLFGRFANHSLENNKYAQRIQLLVVEYNELTFRRLSENSKESKDEPGMFNPRRCHDCGVKTRNYRCDACWVIIKSKSTSCDEPSKEYKILGGR